MTQPPKSDKAKRGQPDSPDEVSNKANWANRTLFHGDNLTCLRAMNSDSVDLIATDPPFNKGRDFHATPDSLAAGAKFQDRWSWEQDVHPDWVDQITDDYPKLMEAIQSARAAHSDGMGAFMCFMAVRLLEMRRVLKDTGSIYLHCDPTASHYLKAVMDAVFGWSNFRSEVIWKRTSSHNSADRWGPVHDVILFYSKTGEFTWNRVTQPLEKEYVEKFYRHEDAHGRYRVSDLTGSGTRKGDSGQPWRGVNPTDRGRHWAQPSNASLPDWFIMPKGYDDMTGRERLDILDGQGLVHWPKTKTGGVPGYKRYLGPHSGAPVTDLVLDIAPVQTNSKERTGYPTQKPLPLYERIIKASSNEGDMVLDPFCGCATTLVAAEATGRQWVGMDIWDNAGDVVLKRLSLHQLVHKGKTRKDLFDKEVRFTTELPVRNDGGEEAAPFLRVKERVREPDGPKMTRKEMYDFLLAQHGPVCQGCYREFDDPRYLQLDHNTPRADGGINHISNRILLCGPCNNLKSNTFTLSGLRRENKKKGYMAKGAP